MIIIIMSNHKIKKNYFLLSDVEALRILTALFSSYCCCYSPEIILDTIFLSVKIRWRVEYLLQHNHMQLMVLLAYSIL